MKWKYPDYLPKPPHSMTSSDWGSYLAGLTKSEKLGRYGSVETSLIPAVELIEAQGLGDINPDPYKKSALEVDTSSGAMTVGSLNGFIDPSSAAQQAMSREVGFNGSEISTSMNNMSEDSLANLSAALNSIISSLHYSTLRTGNEYGVVFDYIENGNEGGRVVPSGIVSGDEVSVSQDHLVTEATIGVVHTHPKKGLVNESLLDSDFSGNDFNNADRWGRRNGDLPFTAFVLEVGNQDLYTYYAGRSGQWKRRYYP